MGVQQADASFGAADRGLLNMIARMSPSWCDGIRLLDSTPVPVGASRETVKRSEFAAYAAYGYCASHRRYFWGFRLYLLCASDGMPIAFELAPANAPERQVAAEMLTRICQRLLALAAGIWHNWQLWEAGIIETPGRGLIAYDH